MAMVNLKRPASHNANCPNGNFLSITEPCNMTCPIAKQTSRIAISSEKCPDKGQCFHAKDEHHLFNTVCTGPENLSGDIFTKYCATKNAKICKNYVTTKNKFSQCFVSVSTS